MGQSTNRAAALIFLLTGLWPAAMSGQEKSPPVSVQTFPKQLALAGGERQQILAVININGDSIRAVKLTARSGLGVTATVGKAPTIPEGFHGDVGWPVTIIKADDGRGSTDITLQATYTSGDPPKVLAGSAFTALTVTLKSRPKAEEVITGAIEASFDRLEERRPQIVHLTLSNLSDVPVTVTGVTASLPDFATLSVPGIPAKSTVSNGWLSLPPAAGALIIQPRQEFVGRYQLEIPDNTQVISGKYLLLLRIEVQYNRDGYTTHGTVVAKKEFQVGVLGEDEFVGVTSVPFLVLPGFVFVTAWAMLLSRFWPRWTIALDYKKPEYYFLSVLCALGAIFLYAKISPWIFRIVWRVHMGPRDTFSGYSLADIINVWLLAVSAAFIPWLLVFGIYSLGAKSIAWFQKKKIPALGDSPEIVLKKLALAHKTLDVPQVIVGGLDLWELPLMSPDPARKWVSGRIQIAIVKDKTDAVEADLNAAMDDTNNPRRLYDALQYYSGNVEMSWQQGGPRLVDKKDAPPKQAAPENFVYLKQ